MPISSLFQVVSEDPEQIESLVTTLNGYVTTTAASETNAAVSETNAAASAAAAVVSKNAAAVSAAAALVSENAAAASNATATNTAADAVQTAADRVQTGLDRASTTASAAAASTDAAQVSTDAAQVASDKTQTAADRVLTGQDVTASAASATAATNAKTAAETAETNAENAETNAANSATAASTSASNAATSETNAATSASTASTQATNASNSASSAATSATNASNSASAASTSASNAAASESGVASDAAAAAASETAAAASETSAATSATNASNSASTASTQASNAATSASTASTQATNAANSASAASNSQTNAAASAVSAASSANQAASSYDEFDDRYLGSKNTSSGNPTTDNDGNALLTGALMWDDTNSLMKVYNGSSWVAAYASSGGALVSTNNLSDVSSASSARGNLGLGTAATTASTDYATAAQGTLASSALQSGDNVSLLTNNAGYLTSVPAQSFSSLTGKPTTISGYGITDAFNGAYASLTGKPTIPTNNSQLTNGAGYITSVPAQSFASLTGKPTTISGYGITDVVGQFTAGTGITIAANGTIATTVTDTDTTYSAGSGLNLSGTTFSHSDTSSQASSNNSGRTYIQDITLDTYGHVTGLATATETVTATTSASDLTSGTLPDARFPSVLPAISGANLTNLPAAGIANVVEDTTPQLGGDLQTNGNDIDFADSDKAVFGAGNDLEIFHDPSGAGHSYINEANVLGNLIVQANSLTLKRTAGNSENYIVCQANDAVDLYFNGAKKLATTNTGVTVTGTLAATAVTGDGSGLTGIAAGATGGGNDQIFYENGQTVTTNYTISNGKNAMSAGPITINTGVTVSVGAGETWTVV